MIILIFLGVFYVIPAGLLKSPFVQEKVSEIVSLQLHHFLNVPVEIGKIDFQLFNKLIVRDVYLEDQQGDTLFQAKHLSVGFEFLPLFQGKLRFNSALFYNFQFHLSRENDNSPLNLQFVIDAFTKDKMQKENNIDLVINNIRLQKGSFTYDVKSAPRTNGQFNAKHLGIDDIDAKIVVDKFTSSELAVDINRFDFKEKSGLDVRNIVMDLTFSKDTAIIKKLQVQLPQSFLQLENVTADFSQVQTPDEYVEKSDVSLRLLPSSVCLNDLRAFVPAFENYKDFLEIKGDLSGNINHLRLDDFILTDEDKLLVQANVELKDLFDVENMFIRGAVKKSFMAVSEVAEIVNNFSSKAIEIPEHILRIGNIRFEGEMSGFFHHLTAYGEFNTDVGDIHTDIQIGRNKTPFIKGEIQSQNIDLRSILLDDHFGVAGFDILFDVQQDRNSKYEGTVDAKISKIEFNQYLYENIDVNGNFTEMNFNGNLNMDSPEGQLAIKGLAWLNGEESVFNLSARAEHIRLDKLNLINKRKESDLCFNLDADITGNNLDNLLGYIDVKDIRFGTETGEYYLDKLTITSQNSDTTQKTWRISSDVVNGSITGQYSFNDVVPAILRTGRLFLPAIIKDPQKTITSETCFNFDFVIKEMKELADILDLPFASFDETTIQGNYNSQSSEFKLEISSPQFTLNKMLFKDCSVNLESQDNQTAIAQVKATNTQKDKNNVIAATFNIGDNKIKSTFNWNNKREPYGGFLNLTARFIEQPGTFPLKTEINILNSEVIFKDSIWNLNPSQIVLDSAKIKINHLSINHDDQYVKVNGIVSKQAHDRLQVDLNNVNLDYIFDILNLKSFELGGKASGQVIASDVFYERQLSTELYVENFSFNKSVVGHLNLTSTWDDEQQGIQMLGYIQKNDSSSMKVDGMLYPIKEMLDLTFDAQNVDAAFLRRYLNNVTKNISGLLTGKINLVGTFLDATVVGDVFVKNGNFEIDFLNTTYTFSDYVHLKPDEIYIKDATFYDKFGKTAIMNGTVRHNYLRDFTFSVDINANNFLAFNATEQKSPVFFGTAFGTGTVAIRGDESLVNIDARLRTDDKTKITLNFMEQADVAEYNFINFVSAKKETPSLDQILSQFTSKPIFLEKGLKSDLKFNLQLTATPNAIIELIMDPVSGDRIKGYGNGNLTIQYGTITPLRLFGKYTIEKGDYNFSFQQALYRDFQIREGSSISFNGDPFTANLDIDAVYSLSANISDLNETLAQEISRPNVPINCILEISGALERPDIQFDIEVPNSGADLERQIRALINTDDMMNRQIIYLLVLNKFYTQDLGTEGQPQRGNELASLAASSLSSQLTSLLGSLSENVQIGTVFSTNNGDFTDTEMAFILSSQLLNNRLLINGNFGYKDNPIANTSFIGDVDIEYKLNKSGNLRLKAYNHYNDRFYSLRSAYTTQGVGLLFRRDFDDFRYMFGRRLPLTILQDSTVSLIPTTEDFIRFRK